MIRVGIASPTTIGQLLRDGILPHGVSVSPTLDTVLVAHRNSFPLSVMVTRPMIWAHGLDLNPAAPPRLASASLGPLLAFASGYHLSHPSTPSGAILHISPDNDKMKRLASNLGVVYDGMGLVHHLDF